MMKDWRVESDWKLVGSSRSIFENYLELSKLEKNLVSIWKKNRGKYLPQSLSWLVSGKHINRNILQQLQEPLGIVHVDFLHFICTTSAIPINGTWPLKLEVNFPDQTIQIHSTCARSTTNGESSFLSIKKTGYTTHDPFLDSNLVTYPTVVRLTKAMVLISSAPRWLMPHLLSAQHLVDGVYEEIYDLDLIGLPHPQINGPHPLGPPPSGNAHSTKPHGSLEREILWWIWQSSNPHIQRSTFYRSSHLLNG